MTVSIFYSRYDVPESIIKNLMKNNCKNNVVLGSIWRQENTIDPEKFSIVVSQTAEHCLVGVYRHGMEIAIAEYGDGEPNIDPFVYHIDNWDLPFFGISGEKHFIHRMSERWNAISKHKVTHSHSMHFYLLEDLIFPQKNVPGQILPLAEEDAEWASDWTDAFIKEAGLIHMDKKEILVRIQKLIQKGKIFKWVLDQKPVSILDYKDVPPNGCRIGGVYTIPDARGCGYGTHIVANLSRELQQAGKYVSLFADVKNPTSNKIYTGMGYNHVCDYDVYLAS